MLFIQSFVLPITLVAVASAAAVESVERRASFTRQNGLDAQAKNRQFKSLTPNSKCTDGQQACINNGFAQCSNGKFVISPCGGGLQCVTLPLVLSKGTSITCDTAADAAQRIANTGVSGGIFGKRALESRATAPAACAAKGKRRSYLERNPLIAKRIAQADLPAVAESWQKLCLASGQSQAAGDPCVTLAGVNGINALLANADACAQQDNADAMIDFANLPGIKNRSALVANAIAYRKHPRNALNIDGVVPSTLFCEKAPKNKELKGVVNGQLDGVNAGLFGSPATGIVAFGAAGTCPFGKKANVGTCSCA